MILYLSILFNSFIISVLAQSYINYFTPTLLSNYDPGVTAIPPNLMNCAAAFWTETSVLYIFGGELYHQRSLMNEVVWQYDTGTSTFTQVTPQMDVSQAPDVTRFKWSGRTRLEAVRGSKLIWLFGGTKNFFFSSNNVNDVYTYDPANNILAYVLTNGAIPPAGWGLTVTYAQDTFFAFGINTGNTTATATNDTFCGTQGAKGTSTIYRLDENTFTWTTLTPSSSIVPAPRFWSKMVSYNAMLYVVFLIHQLKGGLYNLCDRESLANELWSYDINNNVWAQIAVPINFNVGANPRIALNGQTMFVYGGTLAAYRFSRLQTSNFQRTIWAYDIDANSWSNQLIGTDLLSGYACSSYGVGYRTPQGSFENMLFISYGGFNASFQNTTNTVLELALTGGPSGSSFSFNSPLGYVIMAVGTFLAVFILLWIVKKFISNQSRKDDSNFKSTVSSNTTQDQNYLTQPPEITAKRRKKEEDNPEMMDPLYLQQMQKGMTGRIPPRADPYVNAENNPRDIGIGASAPMGDPYGVGDLGGNSGAPIGGGLDYNNDGQGGDMGYGAGMSDGYDASAGADSKQPDEYGGNMGGNESNNYNMDNNFGNNGNVESGTSGIRNEPTTDLNNVSNKFGSGGGFDDSSAAASKNPNYEEIPAYDNEGSAGGQEGTSSDVIAANTDPYIATDPYENPTSKSDARGLFGQSIPSKMAADLNSINMKANSFFFKQESTSSNNTATVTSKSKLDYSYLVSSRLTSSAFTIGSEVTKTWSGNIYSGSVCVEEPLPQESRTVIAGEGETVNIKVWSVPKSFPEGVSESLLHRELTVLNHMRGTPNIIQFVGYCDEVIPAKIITSSFMSILYNELHDANDDKWNTYEMKRSVAVSMSTAVGYLHAVGFVHNRLNPKSVLLKYSEGSNEPMPVLSDFASTMCYSDDPTLQKINDGAFIAMQIRYSAPEILSNLRSQVPDMMAFCSASSDIFSYGMIVYEVITRNSPFQGVDENQVRASLCQGDLPEVSDDERAQYQKLVEVMYKCLSFDPSARPDSFTTIWSELQ